MKDASKVFDNLQNPMIYEYLHDQDILQSIEEVEKLIRSYRNNNEMHLAITTDADEYMGTVSLKHIEENSAELRIMVKPAAMGKGFAWIGMEGILEKAFSELNLNSVYWCVDRNNKRAIRFFDKHNFHEALDIPEGIIARYKDVNNLKWYSALRGDETSTKENVAGCRIIHINTIPTVNAGELSFFEGNHELPFDIKRVYYISKVPEGVKRGFHAHMNLKQLLFCPYGRIQLILENEQGREEYELSDPSIAVLIDRPTWREMLWLQKDSVLCVVASDYYDPEDYIRDMTEFKNYLKTQKS